jgi:hypothetical protein
VVLLPHTCKPAKFLTVRGCIASLSAINIQVSVLIKVILLLLTRVLPVFALILSACAAVPPVQEMSDARQAIAAARDAGAETYAPEQLRQAETSLAIAEQYIKEGFSSTYWSAKLSAVKAKDSAFDALLISRTAREQSEPSAR